MINISGSNIGYIIFNIVLYINTFTIILILLILLNKLRKYYNIKKFNFLDNINNIIEYLINKYDKNKIKCDICYDDISELLAVKNKCKCIDKTYHIKCIYKWKNNSDSCPFCRQKIKTKFYKDIYM